MSMKVEFIEIVFHASKVYNLTGKWFFYSFRKVVIDLIKTVLNFLL